MNIKLDIIRLSNEVFEDLIPQGSSRILVPQTPEIKIWSPQNSPSSTTFPGVPEEQNQAYFTVKSTILEKKNVLPFKFHFQNQKDTLKKPHENNERFLKTQRNPEEKSFDLRNPKEQKN